MKPTVPWAQRQMTDLVPSESKCFVDVCLDTLPRLGFGDLLIGNESLDVPRQSHKPGDAVNSKALDKNIRGHIYFVR